MQNNIYDERCHIMKSWFTSWSDHQRRLFLKDVINNIVTPAQKQYLSTVLKPTCNSNNSKKNFDFSHQIPHSVAILIFSYLDPRSLCRSAQVCWYWKSLTESNDIWMSKCLKLGWCLPINHAQTLQPNAWKQLFKLNFSRLKRVSQPVIKYTLPTTETATMTETTHGAAPNYKEQDQLQNEMKLRPKSVTLRSRTQSIQEGFLNYNSRPSSASSFPEPKSSAHIVQLGRNHPPWRACNRKPHDLIRYNYLDNSNIIWELTREREKIFGKYME
uniref:F-box domain-containing protein n=1 Tax=Strigamia maritima TaxID=126957 RepID=T1ITP2_STRMM